MKYVIKVEYRKGGSTILNNLVYTSFKEACQGLEEHAKSSFGQYYHDYIQAFGGGIDEGELYTTEESFTVIELK